MKLMVGVAVKVWMYGGGGNLYFAICAIKNVTLNLTSLKSLQINATSWGCPNIMKINGQKVYLISAFIFF